VNVSNMPDATIYDNIRSLGHDTEESTTTLIKDIAEVEKRGYESSL